MNSDERELLKFDYEATTSFLDKADGWLFQIRNWAAVSTSALVAYSVTETNYWTLCVVPFLIVGFWLFELSYKSFHEDCLGKSYLLEELLQRSVVPESKLPDTYRFGIGHAIQPIRLARLFKIATNRKRWHNNLTYQGLLLMAGTAFVYVKWVAS